MDTDYCTLPHLEPGHVSTPMEEMVELRATAARVVTAERREAEAATDRRAAELRAVQAEERATQAEKERAATLTEVAATAVASAKDFAATVTQERRAVIADHTENKGGLIQENLALGITVTRLLADNEALTKRVVAVLDALDAERKEHAKLRASRPDVQIEAEKNAAELEKARVEASVRAKEIESNHDLATMLLGGLGSALLPMSEKLMAKLLEEKFPRALQAGTDTAATQAAATKPAAEAKAPLVVWAELVTECWGALSHTSRMQAAFGLAESRWLNVLVVPDTHPIFARMRDEIGAEKVTRLAQMTYALTGVSPVAPEAAMQEQPADTKNQGTSSPSGGGATA